MWVKVFQFLEGLMIKEIFKVFPSNNFIQKNLIKNWKKERIVVEKSLLRKTVVIFY